MTVLTNYYNQLRDLFIGMTPGNRITVALLIAGLLVSFGFLFMNINISSGEHVPLYDGKRFDQGEQVKVAQALAQANLSGYDWKESKLYVPRKDLNKYVAAITEAGVLVGLGEHIGQTVNGFSVYEPRNMMDTKMRVAQSNELAAVLRDFTWIRNASVLTKVRSEMDTNMYRTRPVYSAAVTVWPYQEAPITEEQLSAITAVTKTALGITDLKEISIIDGNTNLSSTGIDTKTKGGRKSYEEVQEAQQKKWEQDFRDLFPDIRGLIVKTSVELDRTLSRTVHDVTHGKPTDVANQSRTTEYSKEGRDIAGRPGMVAQDGTPFPNVMNRMVTGDVIKETTEDSQTQKALQGEEGRSELAPLTLKSVSAVIRVPMSHVRKIWRMQNANTEGAPEEPSETDLALVKTQLLADMQAAASRLVERWRPLNLAETVEPVTVITYNDSAPPEMAEPTLMQRILHWFALHWETLALLGLVLAGMGVLWSMTRVRQPEPIVIYEAAELPQEEVPLSDEELAELEAQKNVVRSLEPFNKSIRSLQTEVTELVDENPDAAASVLRQWIGNVAYQD